MPRWETQKFDGYERDVMVETPEEIEARKRSEAIAKFDPATVATLGQALVQRTLETAQLRQVLNVLGKEMVALKLKGGA